MNHVRAAGYKQLATCVLPAPQVAGVVGKLAALQLPTAVPPAPHV
jgi:hypothetical protein